MNKMLLIFIAGVVVGVLPAAMLFPHAVQKAAGTDTGGELFPDVINPSLPSAESLYKTATRPGKNLNDDTPRIEAAQRLSRHPDGEAWTVLLLLSSQVDLTPVMDDESERNMVRHLNEGRRAHPLGIVAQTIKEMPRDVGTPVLLATTLLLNDAARGRWGTVTGPFFNRIHADHRSQPIRELAHDYLVEAMGVDHGYDMAAWQDEVIARYTGNEDE